MKSSYTAAVIANIIGKEKRIITRMAKKENWAFEWEKCSGGRRKRFTFKDLPDEIRAALIAAESEKVAGEILQFGEKYSKNYSQKSSKLIPHINEEGTSPPAANSPYINEGAKRGPTPTTDELDEPRALAALARADLVRNYLEIVNETERKKKGKEAERFVSLYNSGSILPDVFERLGPTSVKSIERWKTKLLSGGDYRKLSDLRGHARRGFRKLSSAHREILKNLLLFPNGLNIAEVIRSARTVMRHNGLNDDFHNVTARRWIDGWIENNYDQFVFWREGERALDNECLPYIKRDWRLLDVGDCLVADGHTLNFEIINPAAGKPKRMTLIVWLDMRSNYPAGWEIMPTENTGAISIALRRAILRLGKIPRFVYMDNGKAFRAKYFTGCSDFAAAGLFGLYERLGIRPINAWPYHPQSKPVERWFGSFGELERRAPTYVGSSIAKQPPRMNRGEKIHGRLHKKIAGELIPTIENAHRAIAAWIDDEYGSRPQNETHLEGECPLDVFQAGRGEGVDRDELRFLMMDHKKMKIGRNGVRLRIDGAPVDFYGPELYGRKHAVIVRFDRFELALGLDNSVLVYDEKGEKLICRAERWDKIHPLAAHMGDEGEKADFKEKLTMKQSLKKKTISPARKMVEEEIAPAARAQAKIAGLLPEASTADKGTKPLAPKEHTDAEWAVIRAEADENIAEAKAMRAADREKYFDELAMLHDWEHADKLNEMIAKNEEIPESEQAWMHYYESSEEYEHDRQFLEDRKAVYLKMHGKKKEQIDEQTVSKTGVRS